MWSRLGLEFHILANVKNIAIIVLLHGIVFCAILFVGNALEMGMTNAFCAPISNMFKTISQYATAHLDRTIIQRQNCVRFATYYAMAV